MDRATRQKLPEQNGQRSALREESEGILGTNGSLKRKAKPGQRRQHFCLASQVTGWLLHTTTQSVYCISVMGAAVGPGFIPPFDGPTLPAAPRRVGYNTTRPRAHSPHPLTEGNGQRSCTLPGRRPRTVLNYPGGRPSRDRGRGHVPATVDLRS